MLIWLQTHSYQLKEESFELQVSGGTLRGGLKIGELIGGLLASYIILTYVLDKLSPGNLWFSKMYV